MAHHDFAYRDLDFMALICPGIQCELWDLTFTGVCPSLSNQFSLTQLQSCPTLIPTTVCFFDIINTDKYNTYSLCSKL